MIDPETVARLEAVAQAAIEEGQTWWTAEDLHHFDLGVTADYVADADPHTILDLIAENKRLREALDAYHRLLGSARPTLHTPEDDEDTVLGVSLYFTKDQDDELDRVRELTRRALGGGQR